MFMLLALAAFSLPRPSYGQENNQAVPKVARSTPAPYEEITPDSLIEIVFAQPMNRETVAAALIVTPADKPGELLKPALNWRDDTTLSIVIPGLARGERYTLKIGNAAKTASDQPLEPYTLTFDVASNLKVSQTIPANDAREVQAGSTITVVFNKPVVPLVDTSSQDKLPQPLVFQPEIKGKGEWVNTSIYLFKPDPALPGGTTFTVTIDPKLTDTTGSTLSSGYSWKFTTAAPQIIDISPQNGMNNVRLEETVRLTFNQPMDIASVEKVFALYDKAGNKVAGTFVWTNKDATVEFKPTAKFELGGSYRIALTGDATSASGAAKLTNPISTTFLTVPYPAFLASEPPNGSQDAYPGGGAQITFNTFMDQKSFVDKVKVEPKPEEMTISVYSQQLYVNFRSKPLTEYTVTVDAGVTDIYGNPTREPIVIRYKTRAFEPSLYVPNKDFVNLTNAYLPDTVVYANTVNVSQIDVTVSEIKVADIFTLRNDYNRIASLTPLRTFSVKVAGDLNQQQLTRLPLAGETGGALRPGVYALTVSSPDLTKRPYYQPQRLILVVGTVNVTFKRERDMVTAWVTDYKSGLPLPNVPVQILDDYTREIANGVTDQNGILRVGVENANNRYNLVAVAQKEGVFGISTLYGGINVYEFGVNQTNVSRQLVSYVYTDQAIYRPDRPVYFKGILRDQDDVTYTTPAGTVRVTLNNPEGQKVYEKELTLTEFGTFSDQYALPRDARLGTYAWQVEYKQTTYSVGGFQVAEFRLPEFAVTATSSAPEVVKGATIKVQVDSKFFFGGPVSNAQVRWNALANPSYFDYKGDGNWTFGVSEPWYWFYEDFYGRGPRNGGQSVGSGQGVTDADGKFTIELPANLTEIRTTSFTIEATVTDVNNQPISGRTTVTVHPADVYVGMKTATQIAQAGKPVTVDLLAVDWASKPVAGQKIKTSVIIKSYKQDPKTLAYQEISEEVATGEATADDKGLASFTFTPKTSGLFRVYGRALDKAERQAETVTYLWVSGPQPFADDQTDRALRMVSDKRDYLPTDTAEILIPSPFAGKNTALVTVERANVMQTEIITIEGTATYKLPLKELYAPDVYVSVVLIKGMATDTDNPDYRAGVIKLNVQVRQQMTVKLTSNVSRAKPGDTVTFEVLTTDRDGKPIPASVGLKLTDKAALSVAGAVGANIFDAFWSDRGLSVVTTVAMEQLIDTIRPEDERRNKAQGVLAGAANESAADGFFDGGAQPPSAAPMPTMTAARSAEPNQQAQPPATRQNFVDTPLWTPETITDANGKGSVQVKLPDNLTTWQLEGRGISKDTYAGQSDTEIISTLPLLVRPSTPRFFIVGDDTELATVINNNTESDLTVEARIDVKGATLRTGQSTTTVSIPKLGRARVSWQVRIDNVDNVDVVFTAISGEFGDAAKPEAGLGDQKLLPVYKYVAPDYVSTAGTLTGSGTRTELIQLPTGAGAPQGGNLTVNLNTSLAAVTLDGLKYLEAFPYDCTEQTISKFLPNAITYRALQKLGQDSPELRKNLMDAIEFAFAKLKAGQKPDGGWGWYSRDESSPLVTAYAVLGLLEARNSDLLLDRGMYDRAVAFLLSRRPLVDMQTQYWDLNTRAFVEYVLARTGNPSTSALDNLFTQRDRISLFGRAFIAQAYAEAKGDRTRIDALVSDLTNGAIVSATGIHFEERTRDWWNWDSNTRTTAIVLDTLVKLTPQSELIPNVVRWLVVARKAEAWETTQETAWAVMSLTNFMAATGELKANYPYTVTLNGSEIGKGTAAPENLKVTQALVNDVKTLLQDQANKLSVNRGEGNGSLYYTAWLKIDQPVETIKPISRGMTLTRTYYIEDKAVTEAKVGDTITVAIDLVVPHDLHFVVINDPIPSGTEMVDTSLQTTSQIGQPPQLDRINPRYGWGWWWWSDTQLRTEKAVLTAQYLPAGTYRYVYQIQATVAGVYKVIPTNGNEFYFPEVFGRGAGSVFTVKE
jgi:alpha-2-macroglobulin